MSDGSKIEWTDATWNIVIGCDKVSPGCDHCYAIRTAHRMQANPNPVIAGAYLGTESGGEWTGQVNLIEDRLDLPLRWTKPRRIFVNAQSDLFHEAVSDQFLDRVFDVMEQASHHTFQVLTKRHARMRSYMRRRAERRWEYADKFEHTPTDAMKTSPAAAHARLRATSVPPNIWLGVSVETQQWADIRIPALLDTPAAVRFLSCEPLLGPVDLWRSVCPHALAYRSRSTLPPHCREDCCREAVGQLDWVIVGGESGPGSRPMHPDWARGLRDECVASSVPFLFKQWGEWAPHRLDGGEHVNGHLSQTRFQYESRRFAADGTMYVANDPDLYSYPGMASLLRVGKKKAGRALDGRTWDEYPEAIA